MALSWTPCLRANSLSHSQWPSALWKLYGAGLLLPVMLKGSIAGGGGYLAQTGSGKEYKITFGSSGELSATAGAVTVNNSSKAITTKGNYSPALVAQSIGGGGGYALLNASGS